MNEKSMIDGVEIKKLSKIPDERGAIYHMLRRDDELFEKFGEIYFSTAYPSVIKAWHIHKKRPLKNAVIKGMIKLVLYDMRPNSPTKGNLMELFLGAENYCLVKIPAGIANGFKCMGTESCMIANCATEPYAGGEMMRLDPFTKDIPYDWALKHG